jgi:hypothetical protein
MFFDNMLRRLGSGRILQIVHNEEFLHHGKIKEKEMGGKCSTYGMVGNRTHLVENLNERDPSGVLGARRMIVKRLLNKWGF